MTCATTYGRATSTLLVTHCTFFWLKCFPKGGAPLPKLVVVCCILRRFLFTGNGRRVAGSILGDLVLLSISMEPLKCGDPQTKKGAPLS